jgi:hypothetical protein
LLEHVALVSRLQGLLISDAQRPDRIIAGKRKKSLADVLHLGSLLDRSADIESCKIPRLSLDHTLNTSEMPLAVILDDRLEVHTIANRPLLWHSCSSGYCLGTAQSLGNAGSSNTKCFKALHGSSRNDHLSVNSISVLSSLKWRLHHCFPAAAFGPTTMQTKYRHPYLPFLWIKAAYKTPA